MIEIIKLLEYAELSGHPIKPNGDKLRVGNGSRLPYHLKQQIILHKDEILEYLKGVER